jgi:predicted HAD superfamily Cof-like phosphohydrolase
MATFQARPTGENNDVVYMSAESARGFGESVTADFVVVDEATGAVAGEFMAYVDRNLGDTAYIAAYMALGSDGFAPVAGEFAEIHEAVSAAMAAAVAEVTRRG